MSVSGRSGTYKFKAETIRNISTADEIRLGRRVYVGQAPLTSVVSLPTDENVRDYLVEAVGKQRRVPTQVHRAILDTLKTNSENFAVLNSGIVIVARAAKVDDANGVLELSEPSIINGSQTQGVIKEFIKEAGPAAQVEAIRVKYEIIVTNDEDLIAETSIARNFQNDVMTISIVGRLNQLEELERRLQEQAPGLKLKKSETQLSDDYVKTERLLQVIAALVPEQLWVRGAEFNKTYTYSQKTRCLKDFQEIYRSAKDASDPDHERNCALYNFYLDVPAQALALYDKWKKHPGFKGSGIRAIRRDDRGNILDVPDGFVFPILASLSAFAVKVDEQWKIVPPEQLADEELIRVAISVYQEIADHNPQTMGKSKACYSALYEITSIYRKLAAH